jgi:hypothetical protein
MQALARDRVCVVGGWINEWEWSEFDIFICWNLLLELVFIFWCANIERFFVLFDHEVFESFGSSSKAGAARKGVKRVKAALLIC